MFSSLVDEEAPHTCILSVDGASNLKESGTSLVLEGAGNFIIDNSLKFEFKVNNNQVEYKPLIIDMVLTLEMEALSFKATSDS